jgi:hypothetical protein
MGLLREDGTPKLALPHFREVTPEVGLCQWFHFEDPRLDDAVRIMRDLGVRHLRTGLSWADYYRPNALAWFDRQMAALDGFDVTITFCFTPDDRGILPHYASPPKDPASSRTFARRWCEGTCRAGRRTALPGPEPCAPPRPPPSSSGSARPPAHPTTPASYSSAPTPTTT